MFTPLSGTRFETVFWNRTFCALILLAVCLTGNKVFAGEYILPPTGSTVIFQTNGPNSNLSDGDWWTNSDPDAGQQSHLFELYVPCQVDSDFVIELELYDPECFQTSSEMDEIGDVSWDDATFQLIAPDNATVVAEQTYSPVGTTSETWNAFSSFTVRQYGCGVYRLYVSTADDDGNVYKLKIVESNPDGLSNTGDEISISPFKTTYQPVTNGCEQFWFYVPDKSELRLSNFDMDASGTIEYVNAESQTLSGTASEGGMWNNSIGISFPPPGGDVYTNPFAGWWQAEVCVDSANQYLFYPENTVFMGTAPDYPDVQVTVNNGVDTVYTEENTIFTIVAENTGTGPAMNVTLIDTLPEQTSFVEATGSYTKTQPAPFIVVTWTIDVITPGEKDTVTLTLNVNSETSGVVTNIIFPENQDVFFNDYSLLRVSDGDVIVSTGSIGDYVWLDENADGVQDGDESGLADVMLYLVDTNGDTIDSETTDSNGAYLFQPVRSGQYTVHVNEATLPAEAALTTGVHPIGVTLAEGEDFLAADFGYNAVLIPVELNSFVAQSFSNKVILTWTTQSETENLGFNILRSENQDEDYTRINKELIVGAGSTQKGETYCYEDEYVESQKTYYYLLEDVSHSGVIGKHGPISVTTAAVPNEYALQQNYPNPFNPETNIGYSIKEENQVSLSVYNLLGQRVRTLVSGHLEAGVYNAIWKGRHDNGQLLPSGVYIYELAVPGLVLRKRLVYMR